MNNEYNPEREEKDVVEPTTKTSEDVHGGDEITQSMKDQRFAQQQNNSQQNQQTAEQQQNNNQQQSNNDQQKQRAQQSEQQNSQSQNENQQNGSEQQNNQSQGNNEQQSSQQNDQSHNESIAQQQNNDQQDANNNSQQNQQTTAQQNNEQNESQQNNDSKIQSEQRNQQTEQQNQNGSEEQREDETNQQTKQLQNEERTLDDSVNDVHQRREDGEEQEVDEQEEHDEQEQRHTAQYNTQQAFQINEDPNVERQLYLTFYRLVEYLSDEEKQPTSLLSPTLVLNVKKLMMRQYERKPLNAYYYYRTRSQVVLILDNSGSMDWLMDELDTFFNAALKRKDVQIYIAPNGYIQQYYNDKAKRFEPIDHEDAIHRIVQSSLPVIYVGDFDGANTPIELSWTNRVYWICSETRYKYFVHHDWVGRCLKEDQDGDCIDFKRYHEDDFKGFFGRTFNDKEMITVLKEFAKNIQKQRFWYDKHRIGDFAQW